jgi:hypothetical protein
MQLWPLTKAQPKIHWSVCQKHGKFFLLNLKVLKSSYVFIIFKVNFIFIWHREVFVVVVGMQLMATFQILHFFLICNSYEHMYYLQVGRMATNNKNKLPKNSLDFATTSCNCKWKFFCRSCELYICGVYPKLRKYLQLCLTTIRRFCKLLPMKEKSGAIFSCHNPIKFMVDWVVKVGKLWWESRPSYNVENITNGWKA